MRNDKEGSSRGQGLASGPPSRSGKARSRCSWKWNGILAFLVLPPMMAACTTWRTIDEGPELTGTVNREDQVRVTLVSSQMILYQPAADEDRLTGSTASDCLRADCERLTIPRSRIQEIAVNEPSPARTTALVAATVGGTLILARAVIGWLVEETAETFSEELGAGR